MSEEVRYHLLRPAEIVARREACPIAWLPIGTIEWHGVHNPVGTDTLQSEWMADLCAERGGGLSFPPLYMGEPRLTSLMEANAADREAIAAAMGLPPANFTEQERWPLDPYEEQQHYLTLLVRCLAELQSLGFKVGVIVVGHYPLIDHARSAVLQFVKFGARLREQGEQPMLAWACLDYLLVRDRWPDIAGDHAGGWETSHVLASHPDRVDLSLLPAKGGKLVGADGRLAPQDATAELGRETMDLAVERAIAEAQDRLANPGDYTRHGRCLDERPRN